MKCLSCNKKGTHYIKKICPQCTAEGISSKDIQMVGRADWFDGKTPQESSKIAGEFVGKLSKDKTVSHISLSTAEAFGRWETTVTWKEYQK